MAVTSDKYKKKQINIFSRGCRQKTFAPKLMLRKKKKKILSEKSEFFLEPLLSEFLNVSDLEHFGRLNLINEIFHGTCVHHLQFRLAALRTNENEAKWVRNPSVVMGVGIRVKDESGLMRR